MLGKLSKPLLTGLIFTVALPIFASHARETNCTVGLYPGTDVNSSSSRVCKDIHCYSVFGHPGNCTQDGCYKAASASPQSQYPGFGEPGSGVDQKWELFYENSNGGLNQTCEKWSACGPDAKGKPCQK